MRTPGPRAVVTATAVAAATLVLVAAAVIAAIDLASEVPPQMRAAQFQRAVAGLGTGPVRDLSGCAAAFDARLDETCSDLLEPLPGGAALCPCLGRHDAPPGR